MELFFALLGAALAFWWIYSWRTGKARRAVHAEYAEALVLVEAAIAHAIVEEPRASDREILDYVYDGLREHNATHPGAYAALTPTVVASVRRRVQREMVRMISTPTPKRRLSAAEAAAEVEEEYVEKPQRKKDRSKVVASKKCRDCGTVNRGNAYKCAECRSIF